MLHSQPVPPVATLNTLDDFELVFRQIIQDASDKTNASHIHLNTLKNRLFDFVRALRDNVKVSSVAFRSVLKALHAETQILNDQHYFDDKFQASAFRFVVDSLTTSPGKLMALVKEGEAEALLSAMRDHENECQQLQTVTVAPLSVKTSHYTEFVARLYPINPDSKIHYFYHGLSLIGTGFAKLGEQEQYCRDALRLSEASDAEADPALIKVIRHHLMLALYQQAWHFERQQDAGAALQKVDEAIALCKSHGFTEKAGLPILIDLYMAKARVYDFNGDIHHALHAMEMASSALEQAHDLSFKEIATMKSQVHHVIANLLFDHYTQAENQEQFAKARSTLKLVLAFRLLSGKQADNQELVGQYQLLHAATYETEAQAAMRRREYLKVIEHSHQSFDEYVRLPPSQLQRWGLFGKLESMSYASESLMMMVNCDFLVQNRIVASLRAYLATWAPTLEAMSAEPVAIQHLLHCLEEPIMEPAQAFFAVWEEYKTHFATTVAQTTLINKVDLLLAMLMTRSLAPTPPETERRGQVAPISLPTSNP